MALVYGCSTKGKRTLIYRGFEYIQDCVNVCGTISWRCRLYKSLKCKARVVTKEDQVVAEKQLDHTHEGNVATSLARKAVSEMKEQMGALLATPSSSQASVSADLDPHVLMALPKRDTLRRCLQRKRAKLSLETNDGQALPAIPVNLEFEMPVKFGTMVRFDSGPGPDRMIVLGCDELLDGLGRSDVWIADGTFKVVPSVFFQLYSIHFNFGAGINPAGLYCLVTDKTAATYGRVLERLRDIVPFAKPKTVLVDFERAAMNAFRTAYPDARITGCYFHLCQSVIRKVNEVGLKTAYETDNEVRGYVRCLPALAFVPVEDVLEAFELLVETMPTNVDHIDELTTFFEHTYVRGRRQRGRGEIYGAALFPIDLWNQHAGGMEGIARTTNSVEGWHHALQSLFMCHHPTVWTFLDGIDRDIQKQKTLFLHGTAGMQHPQTKKYRQVNERVRLAIAAYGRAEILTYLRSIAHLSYT